MGPNLRHPFGSAHLARAKSVCENPPCRNAVACTAPSPASARGVRSALYLFAGTGSPLWRMGAITCGAAVAVDARHSIRRRTSPIRAAQAERIDSSSTIGTRNIHYDDRYLQLLVRRQALSQPLLKVEGGVWAETARRHRNALRPEPEH